MPRVTVSLSFVQSQSLPWQLVGGHTGAVHVCMRANNPTSPPTPPPPQSKNGVVFGVRNVAAFVVARVRCTRSQVASSVMDSLVTLLLSLLSLLCANGARLAGKN